MKSKTLVIISLLSFIAFMACSLNTKKTDEVIDENKVYILAQNNEAQKTEPHQYGGWYCPDNLKGFPAVNIINWQSVPVVNGRMATQEETRNGSSLIFVDTEKYPNAKPLDITMPKLAKIYNRYSKREDIIIIIQAINVSDDSIVGYRFLNGGSGSARLRDIQLLSEAEIDMIPERKFISHSIDINANQATISEVMRNPKYSKALKSIFDKSQELNDSWRKMTNLNFYYKDAGKKTAAYANMLYGCFYVQNDYDKANYTEKFLLLEDKEQKHTTMKIACGPFANDYDIQRQILINWTKQIKELSEAN